MELLLSKVQSFSAQQWKETRQSMEQVVSKLEEQFLIHFPTFDVLERHWFAKTQQEKQILLQNILQQVCFMEGSHHQWFGMTPQDWLPKNPSHCNAETSVIYFFCKEIVTLLLLCKNESETRQSISKHFVSLKQDKQFDLFDTLSKKSSSFFPPEMVDTLYHTLLPLQFIFELMFLILFGIILRELDSLCKSKLPHLSQIDEEQELENAELLQEIRFMKQKGNKLFHKEMFKEATQEYAMALLLITRDKLSIKEFATEKAVLHANRATCFLKAEQFEKVIQECSASLALQPKQSKTLFRRAYSYEQTQQFSLALQDYTTAKNLLEQEKDGEENNSEWNEIEMGIQRCRGKL